MDRALLRLYMAGCFHYWDQLPGRRGRRRGRAAGVWPVAAGRAAPARPPSGLRRDVFFLRMLLPCCRLAQHPSTPLLPADLARECYARGASVAQLRGCVRHLVVFAGYGPCLAATLALHKAKLLPEDAPGKVRGVEQAGRRAGDTPAWPCCRNDRSASMAGVAHPPVARPPARTLQAAGPAGNAFELVYGGVTDRVRANMQAADPVLQEWIRCGVAGVAAAGRRWRGDGCGWAAAARGQGGSI